MPIDIAIALVLFMRQFLWETKDTSLKPFVGDYNVCCLIMFSLKKEDREYELTCEVEIDFNVFHTVLQYKWAESPK